jgi:HSP20 family protein
MYLTTVDPFTRRAFGPSAVLPLDVVRREGDVLLRFDVPGTDASSVDVTVDDGVLSVSAKRHEERAENDEFIVRERAMGTFTRRLTLPKNLDADAVEAAYRNGVLEVRIPVAEQAKPRKIEVRQGGEQPEQPELAA